jgi:hypothetical protein
LALFDWLRRKRGDGAVDDSAAVAAMYAAPKEAPEPEDPENEEAAEAPAGGGPTEQQRLRIEEALVAADVDNVLLAVADWVREYFEMAPGNAWELAQRSLTRLWETSSWDPAGEHTLGAVLCAIARSERSKDARAEERRAKAYEAYALQLDVLQHENTLSPEEAALQRAQRRAEKRAAKGKVLRLRRSFERAGDVVNQIWLDLRLKGFETPAEMAAQSGRPEKDFYLAAARRRAHVERLKQELDARREDDHNEEEDE